MRDFELLVLDHAEASRANYVRTLKAISVKDLIGLLLSVAQEAEGRILPETSG